MVQAVLRSDRPAGRAHVADAGPRDAAEYITALPKAGHDAADWQVAMETLLLVAERDGPEMLARIAVLRALNRNRPRLAVVGERSQVIGAKSQDTTRLFI